MGVLSEGVLIILTSQRSCFALRFAENNGMHIQENIKLSNYTTYGIGGPARYFVAAQHERDVKEAITWARDQRIPYFILGGGSNLLVSDEGYDGLVISPQARDFVIKDIHLNADAAVSVEELVDATIEAGLVGFEWAGGLPGQLGGAIRGNAGAFGGEIKDTITSVTAFIPGGGVRTFSNKECQFGYRSSIFKKEGDHVILSAEFILKRGNAKKLRARADELIEWRQTKHPLEHGNCGSIFKRINVSDIPSELFKKYPGMQGAVRDNQVATAYFIDQCGLKNKRVGGVEVSDKHPNFLVNISGTARAQDVILLGDIVKASVLDKFGLTLEEEIERVGF